MSAYQQRNQCSALCWLVALCIGVVAASSCSSASSSYVEYQSCDLSLCKKINPKQSVAVVCRGVPQYSPISYSYQVGLGTDSLRVRIMNSYEYDKWKANGRSDPRSECNRECPSSTHGSSGRILADGTGDGTFALVIVNLNSAFLGHTASVTIGFHVTKGLQPAELSAVQQLYKYADGSHWTRRSNWLYRDPCLERWYGVACVLEAGQYYVSKLQLANNQLKGTLRSDTLLPMKRLEVLDVTDNALQGPLLRGGSNRLREYKVGSNQFSSGLSAALRSMPYNIDSIDVSVNMLAEELKDADLERFNSVRYLDMSDNSLSGGLTSLSSLYKLVRVDMSHNSFNGSMPSSLPRDLQWFHAEFNELRGILPPLSQHADLKGLYLSGNQLGGSIPDLSAAISLQRLWLTGNDVSGSIPALDTLRHLEELRLGDNRLSGTIPPLSSLTMCKVISLEYNELSGSLPPIAALAALEYLNVNGNALVGALPPLERAAKLTALYAGDNMLSGTVPALPHALTSLNLGYNELVGDLHRRADLVGIVSQDFGTVMLNLRANRFACPLPAELEKVAAPCNPHMMAMHSFQKAVLAFLGNDTASARSTLEHMCGEMWEDYPPLDASDERYYAAACQMLHNVENGLTLYGTRENTVNSVPWQAYETPISNAIALAASYENSLHELLGARGDVTQQIRLASGVSNVMRAESARWALNADDLGHAMGTVEDQMLRLRAVQDGVLAQLGQEVSAMESALYAQIDELQTQLDTAGSAFFKSAFTNIARAVTGGVLIVMPIPGTNAVGIRQLTKSVVGLSQATLELYSVASGRSGLEETIAELESVANDLENALAGVASLTSINNHINETQSLPDVLPALFFDRMAMSVIAYCTDQWAEILAENTHVQAARDDIFTLARLSEDITRMNFVWYVLLQKQQALTVQIDQNDAIASTLDALTAKSSKRVEFIDNAIIGLKQASTSVCFRALWLLQSESRQLNFASLSDGALAIVPGPSLSSKTLMTIRNDLDARKLSYLNRPPSGIRDLWLNYTITRESHPREFEQLQRTGRMMIHVPMQTADKATVHGVHVTEFRMKIWPLHLDSDARKSIGFSVSRSGVSPFLDSERGVRTFTCDYGDIFYMCDRDFKPLSKWPQDPSVLTSIKMSPFGLWTIDAGPSDISGINYAEVTNIELYFQTSLEKYDIPVFFGGVFADYPYDPIADTGQTAFQ